MPTNPTDDVIERAERLLLEPIANRMAAGERACQLVIDLVVELRASRARVADLEHDARRLDWLSRTSGRDYCSPVKDPNNGTWWVYGSDEGEWTGATIREVIDAAMSAEEGQR